MSDGIGLAEALLGLPGFRVLEVTEHADEVVIAIETTSAVVWCMRCGVRAEAHDRISVEVRDLPCFGRPARLVWRKRRWRCREHVCDAKTWTETSSHFDAQRIITRRAGMEACRQVGELARPVSQVANQFGVCWWTVMNAVVEHGSPIVDDPDRVGAVNLLGVDETSFLRANRATGRRPHGTRADQRTHGTVPTACRLLTIWKRKRRGQANRSASCDGVVPCVGDGFVTRAGGVLVDERGAR